MRSCLRHDSFSLFLNTANIQGIAGSSHPLNDRLQDIFHNVCTIRSTLKNPSFS
jgi:hypothetical protein